MHTGTQPTCRDGHPDRNDTCGNFGGERRQGGDPARKGHKSLNAGAPDDGPTTLEQGPPHLAWPSFSDRQTIAPELGTLLWHANAHTPVSEGAIKARANEPAGDSLQSPRSGFSPSVLGPWGQGARGQAARSQSLLPAGEARQENYDRARQSPCA